MTNKMAARPASRKRKKKSLSGDDGKFPPGPPRLSSKTIFYFLQDPFPGSQSSNTTKNHQIPHTPPPHTLTPVKREHGSLGGGMCGGQSKNSSISLSISAGISPPSSHTLENWTVFSMHSSICHRGCQPNVDLMSEVSSFRKFAS